MKPSERDDLLIRLDERTSNIWRVCEQHREHLEKINGKVEDMPALREGIKGNHRRINWIMWVIGSLIVGGGGVAGIVNLAS